MKLHKDWIVDLYYKEMVIRSNKENNHEQYKRPKQQTEKSSERHRRLSGDEVWKHLFDNFGEFVLNYVKKFLSSLK